MVQVFSFFSSRVFLLRVERVCVLDFAVAVAGWFYGVWVGKNHGAVLSCLRQST